jgi:hypothetical protein
MVGVKGGVGKEDEPWDESVFKKYLRVNEEIIREHAEQLVSILPRFTTKMEDNLVAQMLNRLEPKEFLPLIRRYIEVLEAVMNYVKTSQFSILSGLDDQLRRAESGADVKWVRDWQDRVKHLGLWENAVRRLKHWERHWR